MERLGYVRAASIDQAVTWLNEPGVRSLPLAGGTDLLLTLRANPATCDRVVDIMAIPELHRIDCQDDWVTIGAAVTFSAVLSNRVLAETAPVLVQACRQVGAVQIRNMGTLGGNVANAAACADAIPALVCLEAVAQVLTPQAHMEVPVAELVLGPNRTAIPAGGLLVALRYRRPAPGSRGVFLKLGRRKALAISRLTVAALGRLDSAGRIAEARLAPGAATPRVCRVKAAEDCLLGQLPGPAVYQAAARLVVAEMVRLAGQRWSTDFKAPALSAMTTRALAQVFESNDQEMA